MPSTVGDRVGDSVGAGVGPTVGPPVGACEKAGSQQKRRTPLGVGQHASPGNATPCATQLGTSVHRTPPVGATVVGGVHSGSAVAATDRSATYAPVAGS